MDLRAGDDVIHNSSGFAGVVIARASGGVGEYYEFPGRRNIPVIAVMSGAGEGRFFDGHELSLG